MALTVVKCGGALLAQAPFELERYVEPGAAVCVVHGAGGRITRALADAGVPSSFVNGRPVKGDAAVPIVRSAFKRETRELCRQIGQKAAGLMGDELGLEAQRVEGF